MPTAQKTSYFSNMYQYYIILLQFVLIDGLITVSSRSHTTPVSSNANLSCTVTGEDFTGWTNPNSRTITTDTSNRIHVVSSGSRHDLIIKKVEKSDGGTYRCVTNSTSLPVTLNVEYAPSIMLPQSTTTMQWSSYRDPVMVELKCKFDGYPVPNIELSKDNQPIKTGATNDSGSLTYKFNTKTIDHFGFYACTAKNSQGETTHYMEVAKLGPPEPPGNITVEVSCDYIRVDWIPPFNSRGRPVTSYRVELLKDGGVISGENLGASERSYIFLVQPEKFANYEVRVNCENSEGKGSWEVQPIKTFDICKPGAAHISSPCFFLLVVSLVIAMTTQD